MATIFISYADDRFKESLNRIARQAKRVGIFDKIIKYTPKDLPAYIKASPLFAFTKGGGYWCWKPYIIQHTLKQCKLGDVIFYVDAGCSLNNESPEWKDFLKNIQTHSAIFFQYRDGYNYGWEINEKTAAIRHWIKPELILYFRSYINEDFLDYGKIWGGFMIFKKTANPSQILDQWFRITLFHPEFVTDPFGKEVDQLTDTYCAHRHDQSIITPLVYHYSKTDNALVLPETSESRIGNPAVTATRWIQGKMSRWLQLKYHVWRIIHEE